MYENKNSFIVQKHTRGACFSWSIPSILLEIACFTPWLVTLYNRVVTKCVLSGLQLSGSNCDE